MSTFDRRQRSTTTSSTSTPPPLTESATAIQQCIQQISTILETPSESQTASIQKLSRVVQNLRRCLTDASPAAKPKDIFRHHRGFHALLDCLRAASGYYHSNKRSEVEKEKLFEFISDILWTIAGVLSGHHGNRRYFKKRVEGDGWVALEQAIASIGFAGSEPDTWSENRLFGILLAFAVDDEGLLSICQDLQDHGDFEETQVAQKTTKETLGRDTADQDTALPTSDETPDGAVEDDTVNGADLLFARAIEVAVESAVGPTTQLINKEVVPTIVSFWNALSRDRRLIEAPAALSVIVILLKIAGLSQFNLLALHSCGVLATVLPLTFEGNNSLFLPEKVAVEKLCAALISLGVNSLEDARYLLRTKAPRSADFLLQSLKSNRRPLSIQFDLSLNGFASLELPTLGRPFPPPSSVAGYTFTAWIYVDRFDSNAHTTIFGAFDSSQTCFLLAYLERDTHNFILQTSVTSARPSVRFKSVTFQEKRWYHIAIVHRRPRTITSSKAALFVNGEFAEQIKCQYPASPPATNSSTDSLASFTSTSSARQNPVQAFLGTPQDLSTQLGKGVVLTCWSLASAHLFEDVLSDDLLAVHYRLGPRYEGNFQDCLGSFQTYEASAGLGMRNELMHPGKDEKSDILSAIREKASILMPESKVILSIMSSAVLGDDTRGGIEPVQLLRGLSRAASSALFQMTRSGAPVAINAAVPCINEALVRVNGSAILTGNPVITVPQSIDDAMWRLGGCVAICMKIVEDATTREDIVRGVEILFESVRNNWRNSEAMERDNGYSIIGALIRWKLGGNGISTTNGIKPASPTMDSEEQDKSSFQLLSLVLDFLGYDHVNPENSLINNPLAYRILLVDFDMWRRAAAITQKLYYKQFVVFGTSSKYHVFNSRRLLRMRIVKRFIEAMKGETFMPEVFPCFVEAFDSLVRSSLNADIFRSIALFITYALHKPMASASRTPMSRHMTIGARPTSATGRTLPPTPLPPVTDGKDAPKRPLTKQQVATGILEMYAELLCEKGATANLKKFARTVTNKWLLHLLNEDEPKVVVLGAKILARLLVVHGSSYVTKFTEKTAGFTILRHHLKRWWDTPTLWPICFCILFNHDVADIDYEKPFDLFSLLDCFRKTKVVYPQVLPVIVAMLQQGLNRLVRSQDDPPSPHSDTSDTLAPKNGLTAPSISRRRSMSLTKELEARQAQQPSSERLSGQADLLHTIIRFLADLHGKSQDFKDFAVSSDYVRQLLGILYPIVVSADTVSPEVELNSKNSALTFEGDDVLIKPLSRISSMPITAVRTSAVETNLPVHSARPSSRLRKGSSFVLLTAKTTEPSPSAAKLNGALMPKKQLEAKPVSHAVVEELLELVISVFLDQILVRKEFPGFGLFLKVPPGFREHQAYFQSFILRNTMSHLNNTVQLDKKLLWEPRVINNMARFVSHMGEAVYEGWFLGGAEPLMDFAGGLLEYLQRPDISKIKSVRLCSQAISSIQEVFLRVVLLRLSEIDDPQVTEKEASTFLDKLIYWQIIVLSSDIREDDYLRLVCYQLYTKLVDPRTNIRSAAANLWRILLVQKPDETSAILASAMERQHLVFGFKKLMELDNETFAHWVDEHRKELDSFFFGSMSKAWEDFVNTENTKTDENAKGRTSRRRERLKQWQMAEANDEDVLFRNEISSSMWKKNIYASEHLKYQRAAQDQQDNLTFLASSISKMRVDLERPAAVFERDTPQKWKLDRTEGRNRMRLRMLPDRNSQLQEYQPKRRTTNATPPTGLKVDTTRPTISTPEALATPPIRDKAMSLPQVGSRPGDSPNASMNEMENDDSQSAAAGPEEDFEIVNDPNDNDNDEAYEDKNRKVMRSLQRGDQVQNVFNISRIVGLEACEGLCIIGKEALYLIDNVFQRSDGEIVNVWQAPADERDPYLQMISGQTGNVKKMQPARAEQEARSWKWSDLLSISKRRFLLRDVAVEVFFTDGRSYLLTTVSHQLRDELFSKLAAKSPTTNGSGAPSPEEAWRLEVLRVPDETTATLGSKFGNIFNASAWNPAMRRWAKGEISNFHYLMLVNTMAGRTFNDLTQYPVFPWVLADYTSEELDLNNPASFRDLSKPMGAQSAGRQAEFVERYKSFAEMGDQPPFHYGTHYSSAMIVTSYLIRLQPFVQSYLLLQGGNFDHPDRLFYSIEKAWASASRDNMTDVRELIPEFFYLPEFLTNSNGYNFGMRQGTGGAIDNVVLPPWAKGDPKIFVAKHREALESPYVSQHLHSWIDIIFGSKQRGEAAIENTNVFHHLSYHGAKDLDTIEDEHERLATIGIIHNFGQTPHQVFSRPHQAREHTHHKSKRLDIAAESLTRLPFPLLEQGDSISSLIYSSKLDRLLCATAFKLNMPPHYDKHLEWGFADNSVRFFQSDNKKLVGLFENLHQGQLSCALFADSRTLITAGVDCVVSVWQVSSPSSKQVDLQPRKSLFGHMHQVSVLAVSKSFSVILSASVDGMVLLWDLNRLEFVRLLIKQGRQVEYAQINDVSGDIMLCRGQKVALYTLNGELILEQNVCLDGCQDDYISCCAFYEGQGNEWLENNLVLTGHKRGVVNVWKKCVGKSGKWVLELVKRLDHAEQDKARLGDGVVRDAATITCVAPMPAAVYTGDEDGRVYEWDIVQRER